MKETYFVNGSTVRQLEAQPVRRKQVDRKKIQEQQQKKRRRNAARRNRERALHMSKGYVVFLTACVAVVAFIIGTDSVTGDTAYGKHRCFGKSDYRPQSR